MVDIYTLMYWTSAPSIVHTFLDITQKWCVNIPIVFGENELENMYMKESKAHPYHTT